MRQTLLLGREGLNIARLAAARKPSLATVLCTSGLAVEAQIARAAGFSVIVGVGDRDRTMALVRMAAARTDCIVSFGIAGGLAPRLRAGTVIVSGEVVSRRERWEVDARYRDRLAEFAGSIGAVQGPVLGARSILATQSAKRQAWAATGAIAVDLESEIVARTAVDLGIPFLVLRTIADSAGRNLPPASLIPLAADGTPDHARVFGAVLRRPFQLAGMMGLARETRTALTALIGPARALGALVSGT